MSVTLKLDNVQFPAVQVPSSDANNLDDYEEGVWTPVLGGDTGATGQTYTRQLGSYTKVGRLVTVFFDIQLSVKGTPTGSFVAITGLPFLSASLLNYGGNIGYAVGFNSTIAVLGAYVGGNMSLIYINGAAAAGTSPINNLALSVLANGTGIIGSASYNV